MSNVMYDPPHLKVRPQPATAFLSVLKATQKIRSIRKIMQGPDLGPTWGLV
jgi:hypothetical protein